MTLEESIKTAIDYEIRIRDIYREALTAVKEEAGKRIFETLSNDEQNHIRAVQFELDYISKTGYWFDFKEFDME